MRQTEPVESPQRPKGRRKRWMRWLFLIVLVVLIGGELFARFYLGLGDPPLMMDDPEIEYLFQPSKTYSRFGNHIHYNEWSMRSDDFPRLKGNPDEVRILVIGDSVINGGSVTDQNELATQLLQENLSRDLKRPVVVGNISANTWGPENQLAYVRRFGRFDADVVIFQWSSEDCSDVPTFHPMAGNQLNAPSRKPVCALWDGLIRYFLPRIGIVLMDPDPHAAPATQPARSCIVAMHELIQMFKPGSMPIIYLHVLPAELGRPDNAGMAALREVADAESIRLIDSSIAYEQSLVAGEKPFRDIRHLSVRGQKLMESLLQEAVLRAIRERASAPATQPS